MELLAVLAVPLSSAHYIRSHFPRKRGQLMGVRHCVNSPLRFIPRSGRSAPAPSPANRIGLRCKKLEIDPGSAHKVVARWRRGACLQLPVLELLRFAASSTGRAQLRNVAGQLDGARQAWEDREQQNGKEKEQSVWTVLFLWYPAATYS